MVYEAFLQAIREALTERMGPSRTVTLCRVPRTNGPSMDSLCIGSPSQHMTPIISLGPFYEQFCAGASMEEIVDDIAAYGTDHGVPPNLSSAIAADELSVFDQVKGRVIYRLIHTQSNEELLQDIPHIPYLDLSIVFYLFLGESESEQTTALIHNSHCGLWGTDARTLYQLAASNTPFLQPARIKSMAEVIREIALRNIGTCFDEELIEELLSTNKEPQRLYVLTNRCGIHGASCILYDHVLRDFAGTSGCDLVVLPSSIHEVLLVPDDGCLSYEGLNQMVAEINRNEVPPEDRLSDHIYHYSQTEDTLSIPPYPESIDG